jgi:biopolymer transport protein ExbD
MSVKIDKGRLTAGLELTPMIDVVFLLMIFFLVASKLDEADRSIDVILPQASAAKPLTTRPREFVINIDRAGNYYAGARPVRLQDLRQLLRQSAADNPQRQTVILRADEETAHKFVVAAMDACVQAGIDDYQVQSASAAPDGAGGGPQ